MQLYPVECGFIVGQSFTIGVQPNKRFSMAIYTQEEDAQICHLSDISVTATSDVQRQKINGKFVFQSLGSNTPMPHDQDWNWPTVTIKPTVETPVTGCYVAVAYEVDANGVPETEFGRRAAAAALLNGFPPDSDNMALIVGRPQRPTAAIAYIVPIATYHAYNSMGGGSFYDDHIHHCVPKRTVTLRRPGGGLGAQLGEPTDPYDPVSPRQQFTHWDSKFIRWLLAEKIACDFYTDVDLHVGLMNLAAYKCMLSVGHHEYWSYEMRSSVSAFIAGGGNLAVFSGNTCFRPIAFGAYRTGGWMKEVNRLADHFDEYNESQLLGLSYGFGGGQWGEWTNNGWTKTARDPIGYTVTQAGHWAFAGTGLGNGQTFGADDRLAGYEVDGTPRTPAGFNTIAHTPSLNGWQDNQGPGAMGTFGTEPSSGPKRKLVFNAGTTDWARVLIDPHATSHAIVAKITKNVLTAFTA